VFLFSFSKPMCTLIKLSPQQLSRAVNGLRVVINILFDGVSAGQISGESGASPESLLLFFSGARHIRSQQRHRRRLSAADCWAWANRICQRLRACRLQPPGGLLDHLYVLQPSFPLIMRYRADVLCSLGE
jgi:hypothetical protein